MSSTIFYRFRSQNKNSKITFDGTGLTVFDLKKEIISTNKMAPATDFNLSLYNPDNNEEYADDNSVIPRSSMVIAKRYPSQRHSRMNASRYVGGKPRMSKTGKANLDNRGDLNATSNGLSTKSTEIKDIINLSSTNASEDDKIKAMFQNQQNAWQETQEQMDNATPVFVRRDANGSKEEAPPPGYICYRCGGKDHFIKNCPTNSDANFDGKRIKRTAGIPKSSLKVVEKPTEDEAGSLMLTEDGKFVVAMADKQAWESFQKKQKLFNNISTDTITDKTLIDPETNKLYQKPFKTPCCGKTYSLDVIESLLIDRDFQCPNCDKQEIYLDQLKPDEEMTGKIKKYLESEAEKNGLKRSDLTEEDIQSPIVKKFKPNNVSLPVRPAVAFNNNNIVNSIPMMAPPPFIPPFMPPPFAQMPPPQFFNGNNNSNGEQ